MAVTVLQEVLLEFEADYLGNPYGVSGRAVHAAVARRLDGEAARGLAASRGVFVPGEWGAYPEWHSQDGGVPYMGTGLRPVEAYEDLFLFRHGAQRWLSASRPRDAHNTHSVRAHGDRLAVAPTRVFGRPPGTRNSKRTMTWYLHFYLHAADEGSSCDGDDVVPVADDVLDGLRFGGARNYGFGETSLKETQTIDVDALDFSRVERADAHCLEVVSPFVLRSECPGADDQSVPWWWDMNAAVTGMATEPGAHDDGLRRRETRLVIGGDVYAVTVVDHGQVVGYAGDCPVETAKKGVTHVGTHAKFGFGELRVWPADADRVPERREYAAHGSRASEGGDA